MEDEWVPYTPSSSSSSPPPFSLRIVSMDYYMAPPVPELDACYSSLQGQPIAEVPVVRIFGPTISGQKMCLHLHQAFPYLYVPYDEDLPQDSAAALGFVRSLAAAIERALKLASTVGAKRQHVYSCSLVRGKKFYGYHSDEQLFVKIMLYHPQEVLRLSTLLLGGGILNRPFQPYESHIPFLLQIMIDHNLAGMGYIHLADIKFRSPLLKNKFSQLHTSGVINIVEELVTSSKRIIDQSQDLSSSPIGLWCTPLSGYERTTLQKQSTCELEGDTSVEEILNHKDLLYIPLEKAGPEIKMVQSLIPIWQELDIEVNPAVVNNEKKFSYEREIPGLESYVEDFKRVLETILVARGQSLSCNEDESFLNASDLHKEDIGMSAISNVEKNPLLLCTQAAHSKSCLLTDENNFRSNSIKEEDASLLNEDMINHQLTQNLQDTDDEALDLLRWMISSQQEDANDNEKVDDETSWSQVFQCADEALAKALSDYELSSQQECQAIIDCLGEDKDSCNDKLSDCIVTEQRDVSFRIPQMDGSCDEMDIQGITEINGEEQSHTLKSEIGKSYDLNSSMHESSDQLGWGPFSVKRQKQFNVKQNMSASSSEDNVNVLEEVYDSSHEENILSYKGQSLRDLMRKKRTKRKQMYAVLPESLTSVEEGLAGKKRDTDGCDHYHLTPSLEIKHSADTHNELNVQRFKDTHTGRKHDSNKTMESFDGSLRFGVLPLVKAGVLCSTVACNSIKASNSAEIPNLTIEKPNIELNSTEISYSATQKPNIEPNLLEIPNSTTQESNSKECNSPVKTPNVVANSLRMPCTDDTSGYVYVGMTDTHIDDAELDLVCSVEPNLRKSSDLFTCPAQSASEDENMPVALTFSKKPPSAEHMLNTLRDYNLPLVDHEHAFYGKQEDLPGQHSVMAGMVFEVMSKQVDTLVPYQFGNDMEDECSCRAYAAANAWIPSKEDNSIVLPSHFQNDGTLLFMLSPVKLPPTLQEIYHWLSHARHEQENARLCEHSDNCSQDNYTEAEDASQPSQTMRPSSPKYDETVISSGFSANSSIREANSEQSGNLGSRSAPSFYNPQHSKLGPPIERQSKKYFLEVPYQQSREDISQISGATAQNDFTPTGFKDPASSGCGQQISVMSIEIFASTRGDLRPDPRYDMVNCIIVVLQNDTGDQNVHTTVLLCDETYGGHRNADALISSEVITMKEEVSLFQAFIWLVRIYDPDIIVGWEIQGFSLGLLAERAANLGIGLLREISRLPIGRTEAYAMENMANGETGNNMFATARIEAALAESSIIDDEWGRTHGSGIHVSGRIVLNLWRIMRGEIKLGIYTLEAVAEAVLKRKVPLIPWRTLTSWFSSGSGRKRHLCMAYYIDRAKLNLEIMNQLDLINRYSELARIFGIDFFSVLSRGSQFRVESMMFRLAHSQNYLMISPSRQQVASQPAMQCLPLVMEPESRFYTDPVVVLDFQSLYPSMMIAYNLCFSTCLGKVVPDNPKVLGVTSLNLESRLLKDLKDSLTFTPNGIMFASSKVRPGVLPRLLDEILSTRIMVKQSMKKLLPNEKVLQRVLNARQLALKLISNVTYGYTAAGFSGRMPCAELADSIVQCGRYTLETAINFVNNSREWNARVVYGDTDSMFVLLKGRTKEQAFKIGEEIAAAVTAFNPHPVTLKMEKVYHPCVLLTKKRYTGYSYETPKQVTPKFDAKGIETVRRDSCGAVAKTLEKSLRILFESRDLSQVKSYLQKQWGKILSGRISIKDFIFAKEVRLGTYSTRSSVIPPAAIVATKAMSIDPRAEPRYGERISYLVIHGEPGARLVDMVIDPYAMLDVNSPFRLHDTYYITKQIIPALQRVFGLVGIDLNLWYNEMPRQLRRPITKCHAVTSFVRTKKLHMIPEMDTEQLKSSKHTIDHYYLSQHCVVCGELIQSSNVLCENCSVDRTVVGTSIMGRSSRLEKEFKHLQAICKHCGGGDDVDIEEGVGCISLACKVFFERSKVQKECKTAGAVKNRIRL